MLFFLMFESIVIIEVLFEEKGYFFLEFFRLEIFVFLMFGGFYFIKSRSYLII